MSVIVGFNRDRDNYQVPLAFAEVDALDTFVTDYYHGKALQTFPALSHRCVRGLDPRLVRTTGSAFGVQALWDVMRKFLPNTPFPSTAVDRLIGRRIARAVRASPQSDLLVYSGYARDAFASAASRQRVLYEYHPGSDVVREALADDEMADLAFEVMEPEQVSNEKRDILADERGTATSFVVSSSFTATGLRRAGVPASRIDIIPYGVDIPAFADLAGTKVTGVNFLFIGQGVRRKGLHILFEAWRRARLRGCTLTVVCYRIDTAIRELAVGLDGVQVLGKQPDANLAALYATHDVLVLPSLVEGFGLVLLEALAYGCRLVGTQHTGLPDLDLPSEISTVALAGDIASLASCLAEQAANGPQRSDRREYARRLAEHWSWGRYRQSIRQVMHE